MATKKTPSKQPKQAQVYTRTHFFQDGFWSRHWIPAALLAAVALVLYGITLGFGYLQDDQLFIWDNTYVQNGFGGLWDILTHDSLLGYYKDPKLMLEGGRYRPLPLLTFAMEVGLFGKDNPGAGHLFNVLYYAAAGLMLYRVLAALFPIKEGGQWYGGVALWASLLFMAHPLHTEVVANIKSRDEIFALMGSLGALWAMLKYTDTEENRWRWIAAAGLFLGLLSKENSATFLAVIPLTLWVFSGWPIGRILSACTPLVAAAVVFLLLRAMALDKPIEHADELVLNPFFGMQTGERLATIFVSLGWYVKLLFVPHPLTIDYYPYHVPRVSWSDWRPLAALALYAGMGIWALRSLKKNAVAAYSILYFLLTISVVSNILVRTSTFLNERYLFMPSVGFCLLAAWFCCEKLPALLGKPATTVSWWNAGLLGAVAVLFGIGAWTRVPDWGGDGTALVKSALRVSGDSYRANYYYANLLYQTQYRPIEQSTDPTRANEKKTLRDSIEYYVDRSLQINPGYRLAAPLKVQMAVARYNEDKNLDRMLKDLERLIQAQPTNGDMLTMVLNVLKSCKGSDPNVYNFFCHRVGYNFYYVKMQDPEGGITFLNLALENFPQDYNTMQDLIQIYSTSGNQAKVQELRARMAQPVVAQ